ncbi:hypothetical protein [Biostraticola tofi]|uniref:Uncharacterized protein n=1 Tax=Biostraticola tofi TaxID=466109 RepID=A0A4R3YFA0_9GAMM|nr:hypothetical protein [Biostraticola tofi]TCV91215.1 hypothetical protein EDC52_11910 [Biostraticola tofi]
MEDEPDSKRTLTVRNVPAAVDDAITLQAKVAGKSKSDFVQEFLSATFGDLIGNFIRTSALVALMDNELAKVTGYPLTAQWYDSAMTLAGNREHCRILGIRNEDDLQQILMANVPYLAQRARQLEGDIPLLPHGISLTYALFADAAGRDLKTLRLFYRGLYYFTEESCFWAEIGALREAKKLAPLELPNL